MLLYRMMWLFASNCEIWQVVFAAEINPISSAPSSFAGGSLLYLLNVNLVDAAM